MHVYVAQCSYPYEGPEIISVHATPEGAAAALAAARGEEPARSLRWEVVSYEVKE